MSEREPTIADVLTAVGKLDEKVEGMRVDLSARMDRLQDSLTSIRDDIAVNMATADDARKRNDHTRDEARSLGDIVAAMQRQIQRLQTQVREIRGDP